jgi:hypothetical protein
MLLLKALTNTTDVRTSSKVGGLSGRLGRARYPVARPKSVKPENVILYAVTKGPPGRTYQAMTAMRRGGCPKECRR